MKDILSYVLQVEQKVESVKIGKSKVRPVKAKRVPIENWDWYPDQYEFFNSQTKREVQQVLEKEYSRLDMIIKEKLTKLAGWSFVHVLSLLLSICAHTNAYKH